MQAMLEPKMVISVDPECPECGLELPTKPIDCCCFCGAGIDGANSYSLAIAMLQGISQKAEQRHEELKSELENVALRLAGFRFRIRQLKARTLIGQAVYYHSPSSKYHNQKGLLISIDDNDNGVVSFDVNGEVKALTVPLECVLSIHDKERLVKLDDLEVRIESGEVCERLVINRARAAKNTNPLF